MFMSLRSLISPTSIESANPCSKFMQNISTVWDGTKDAATKGKYTLILQMPNKRVAFFTGSNWIWNNKTMKLENEFLIEHAVISNELEKNERIYWICLNINNLWTSHLGINGWLCQMTSIWILELRGWNTTHYLWNFHFCQSANIHPKYFMYS